MKVSICHVEFTSQSKIDIYDIVFQHNFTLRSILIGEIKSKEFSISICNINYMRPFALNFDLLITFLGIRKIYPVIAFYGDINASI